MTSLNRRNFIQSGLGSLAFASMSTQEALANNPLAPKPTHHKARAKNVIVLFMSGAPSHVDTFDYKPALINNDGSGGGGRNMMAPKWEFKQRGQSGLWISDLFPHLSQQADELCLLRGMHGDQPNHPTAERAAHTGSGQFIRPSLGAWSVYGLGTENTDLPGFVQMGSQFRGSESIMLGNAFLPARYQATTVNPGVSTARPDAGNSAKGKGKGKGRGGSGDSGEPIPNIANSRLDLRSQRTQLDLLKRLNEETLRQERHQPQVEGILQSYELAYRMQSSMPEVMNLSQESDATKAMYGLGDAATASFGTQCLLARRMVESGVRFVELSNGGWDHHTDITRLEGNCGAIDKPIAGLLADLKQRDLLKDTLVIWAGEFGRTPHGTGNGRGHNNKGWTTWMAGGGVKGGFSYGATDDFGYEAVEGKMHTHDWHATILHLMGLDHEKLTYRYAGRDFRLTDVRGVVAEEILA